MIHQALDPPRRVAKVVIPEPRVPLGQRASLRRPREPARPGKYLGDIPALELGKARNRSDDRAGESHEGERRIVVVEDVLEPLAWVRTRRDRRVEKREHSAVPGARDDG